MSFDLLTEREKRADAGHHYEMPVLQANEIGNRMKADWRDWDQQVDDVVAEVVEIAVALGFVTPVLHSTGEARVIDPPKHGEQK